MTDGSYTPMTEAQAHSTITGYRSRNTFAVSCAWVGIALMVGLFGLLCFLAGQHFPA